MARNRKAALQTGGGSLAHQEALDHMEEMVAAVIPEEIVTGIQGQDSAHYQDTTHMQADQGYGIQPWIMTPFSNLSTAAERAYNEAHRRTRSIVDRTFGILKSRFCCLDITGGSLLYSPEMVCRIILTCAILHNICVRRNIPPLEPEPHMPEEEEEEDDGLQQEGELQNTAAGIIRR
ncbi:hypothetical protein NDU88_003327 [Pleurodeles waltl]|uniref:DDE Tnp4 domain-containing protein n=1 Tax=Pleurodeles waltl TaxID=8319 RepID=A0AAV7PHV2_PLEWA|nr:hypothetical protein NDU88_003327 [Pleurodeles waltl]